MTLRIKFVGLFVIAGALAGCPNPTPTPTPSPSPSPSNRAPLVWLSPGVFLQDQVAPASLTIAANAVDPDGRIALVEFFRDGVKFGEAHSSPFQAQLDGLDEGSYVITARATDDRGALSETQPTQIRIEAAVNPAAGPVLNIRDLGATGLGWVDDTDAVKKGLNALRQAGGGTLYFPRGYYNVGETLDVPSNVTIQGESSQDGGYCQIRFARGDGFDAQGMALFTVSGGASGLRFKDIELRSMTAGVNVYPRTDADRIASEMTTGVRMTSSGARIHDIVFENLRIVNFTRGIEAIQTPDAAEPLIDRIRIRGLSSDANYQALYLDSLGATDWDMQNLNLVEMYRGFQGVHVGRAGRLRFLQLSCAATNHDALLCARIERHGGIYFRELHVEGPQMGVEIEEGTTSDAPVVFENSAFQARVLGQAKLYLIGGRAWRADPKALSFEGAGKNSRIVECGTVYVDNAPETHLSHTETGLGMPDGTPFISCPAEIATIQSTFGSAFAQGYEPSRGDLPYSSNVRAQGAQGDGVTDDTAAIRRALSVGGVYFPRGIYLVRDTLLVPPGTTIQGEPGAEILFAGVDLPLFRIDVSAAIFTRGIAVRDLSLRAQSRQGSVGIEISGVLAAAGDMQFNGLRIEGFDRGIWVHPNSDDIFQQPEVDSVVVKDLSLVDTNVGVFINDDNSSNWNFERTRVSLMRPGSVGLRLDRGGHVSLRGFHCEGASETEKASSCLEVSRQAGMYVQGLSASGVETAVHATQLVGYTPFPWVMRDSDLSAGVSLEGRVFLTSIGNWYGSALAVPGQDTIGAQVSRIVSCDDRFVSTRFDGLSPTYPNSGTGRDEPTFVSCR